MNRFIIAGSVEYSLRHGGFTATKNNLILDQGLNYIASYPFADCFLYCNVGDSGYAPTVGQSGLGNELIRITYATGSNYNGADLSGDSLYLYRTFEFPEETGDRYYCEAGFSPFSGSGNNLFSRVLLTGNGMVGVTVPSGDGLRVKYRLRVQLTDSPQSISPPINGSNVNASYANQKVGLMGINSDGDTVFFDSANGCNEPSLKSKIFLTDDNPSFAALGSSNPVTSTIAKTSASQAYVVDSHIINKAAFFFYNEIPSGFKCVILGSSGVNFASDYGCLIKLDSYYNFPPNSGFLAYVIHSWGR